MKEHPIIFSDVDVRAILDGRKTQTRRPIKPQPDGLGPSHWYFHAPEGWWTCGDNTGSTWRCPYGQPGTHLWVRERSATSSVLVAASCTARTASRWIAFAAPSSKA